MFRIIFNFLREGNIGKMNKFLICISILIYIALNFSNSQGDPQFEIHAGNCSKAVVIDLVFQKNVHLTKIPFVIRDDTVSFVETLLKLFKNMYKLHFMKYPVSVLI